MTSIWNKLKSRTFLTDGGLETDLIFNKGIDLPHFAAFPLIEDPLQSSALDEYYCDYLELAKAKNTGFILESPTWRANSEWGYTLGYSDQELFRANQHAIEHLQKLKVGYQDEIADILISGCIGPRGDGYMANGAMTPGEAAAYHHLQIEAFNQSGADFISALTMTNIDEAMGISEGAKALGIPVTISFTVETDGNLPSGESIAEAISSIDAQTDRYPMYYMINCAHPSHFANQLTDNHDWNQRIHGIRANASYKSHAELDASVELDKGDKADLGKWYHTLGKYLPSLQVYGGCCGTDVSHIESIYQHIFD